MHVVEEVSLDHDLGPEIAGTVYDVLVFIARQLVVAGIQPPKINIHTANPAARKRMVAAKAAIQLRAGGVT
jgi:NifB/MoaA-like Fe-S oxidoreductase